ncbi:MAG: SBBP repeat-containing protein [Burkholderiales bacterium]|nr:SBBP repeat-containing protein [Burkholderiales bacterium]
MKTLNVNRIRIFFYLAALVFSSLAGTSHALVGASPPKAQFANLPLAFEPSATDAGRYVARSQGYALQLSKQGAQMWLQNNPTQSAAFDQVTMRFRHSQSVTPEPQQMLPSVSNYYHGKHGPQWRRDVPNYAQVKYTELYPGVAAVFYGTGRQLEYDFQVAAGADPSAIQLEFQGAKSAVLDEAGALHLTLKKGEIVQHAPVIYQIDATGKRVAVEGGYRLAKQTRQTSAVRVSFNLGQYDRSLPLVIDPVLSYSSYFGGSGDEGFEGGVAVDGEGNILLAGWTGSTDFPTANSVQGSFQGWIDAVVVKLDPTGQQIIYSTYLGGKYKRVKYNRLYFAVWGYDYAFGIAVDTAGNAYITGKTSSPDFPVTPGAYDTTCGTNGQCDEPPNANNDRTDSFVTKLSPTGGLVYSTFLGGNNHDIADAIAVDAAGNATVTGWTASTDFPLVNAVQSSRKGYTDAFVTKLNAEGSGLIFSTYLGGALYGSTTYAYYPYTYGWGVTVDGNDNVYVTGQTSTKDFPITPGVYQPTYNNGYFDGFITKFDPIGQIIYSTFLGGALNDKPESIAVDAAGTVYITGETNSPNFPLVTPFQSAYAGGTNDGFISHLSADGSQLLFSTYLGGSGNDVPKGIAVDAAGRAHVSGYTDSTNFPVYNAVQSTNAGGIDAFLTKLDASGASVVYSTYLGGKLGAFGTANDASYGVALDSTGNQAYIAGSTQSNDFPLAKPYQNFLNKAYGISDAFVAIYTASASDGNSPPPLFAADLVASLYASPDPVYPGTLLTYVISVMNIGNAGVGNVTLTDPLPVGVSLYSAQASQGSCSLAATITCTLGTLAAGSGATVTIVVTPNAAGAVSNTVSVSPVASDPTPANNSATVATTVTIPVVYALNISKAGTGSGTVSSFPSGVNCGADCTEPYNNGTVVTLTAIATSGSAFAGWSGDADCGDGSVTMSGNRNCTATFVTIPVYALNISKAGTGSGTVSSSPSGVNCGADCTEPYNDGTVVTLTAIATSGSVFAGWSGDADCGDGAVTMSGNRNCTATFNVPDAIGSCIGSGSNALRGKVENDGGGLAGVTLSLTGPNGCTANTLTDAIGNFQFLSLATGTYTATPSKGTGCGFTPASNTLQLFENTDIDFITTCW